MSKAKGRDGPNSLKSALKTLGYRGVVVVDHNEVKRKYRKLSRVYHPDLPTGSEDKFKRLKDAYDNVLLFTSNGQRVDLVEKVCRIKQGKTPLAYVINGVEFHYS